MSRTNAASVPQLAATVGLATLTLATAVTFRPLFSGASVVPTLVTAAAVLHGLCWLMRLVRWPWWVALPIQAMAVLLVAARAGHAATLRLGIVPTGTTLSGLRDDVVSVWQQFPTALVPVPSDSAFLVAATVAVGVVALTADAFAFRAHGRVEALAPAAVTFVVTSAVAGERLRLGPALGWLAIALVALALLRLQQEADRAWIGRRGPAFAVGRVAVALGVVAVALATTAIVAPRLPGAGADALIDTRNSPNEVAQVVSPMVDIRSRLVNRSNTTLFTVQAERAAYWRLAGLARFDGRTWNLPDPSARNDGAASPPEAPAGPLLQQLIEIRALGSNLVPAAYLPVAAGPAPGGEPQGLSFLGDAGALVVEADGLRRGLRFEVVSQLPAPDRAQLATATSRRPPAAEYLALPPGFADRYGDLARQIAGADTRPYVMALNLQTWFRTEFTYDLDVPPGHGEDAIADFLERRRGYCEQFAGTFAAFARSLGLPARVAVGFTSGLQDSTGTFVVRGRHAHAWPEVWFDGIGWVLFEPTPGRGAPGAEGWTGVAPEQDQGGPADQDPTGPTTTFAAPTTEPGGGGPTVPATGGVTTTTSAPLPAPATRDRSGGATGAVILAVLVVAIAWLTLMPPIVRLAVRSRRRRPEDRVLGAWRAAATALDTVGARRRPDDTPLEHARRAARLTGLDPASLTELAGYATRTIYDTSLPSEAVASRAQELARYVVNASADLVPWQARWRRRVDPRRVAQLA